MERIPILKMGGFLLVSIQVDKHDQLALQLQDDLTSRIVSAHAKGVLAFVCVVAGWRLGV